MAAKPTSTPGWAPTDGSKVIEPSGAQKMNGYDPGFRPPSQWYNWFWKQVSDWLLYLSDGQLEGNHSIAGDLAVEGSAEVDVDLDVGGSLAVVGNGSIGGLATLNNADVTGTLDVTGSATVGGALDVTGLVTIGTNLDVTGLAVVDGVLTVGDDLALKETPGGSWRSIVRVPTGWDAAAVADSVIVVPPQAQVFTNAELGISKVDTFTPTISASNAIVTTAVGWYQRFGHLAMVYFHIAWNGGVPSGALFLGGLPIASSTTIRGQTTPLAAVPVGTSQDGVISAILFPFFSGAGTSVGFYTTAGTQQGEYAAGNLRGYLTYPVA